MRNLLKGQAIRNALFLAGGTAMAQAINIVSAPLLTRVFSPESFGYLGVFQSVTNALLPIATLSYPLALIRERTSAKASVLLSSIRALSTCIVLAIFLAIVILEWGEVYTIALGIPFAVIFIGAMLMSMSSLEIGKQWALRNDAFRVVAVVLLLQALTTNVLRLTFGVGIAPTTTALISATLVGSAVAAALLWAYRVRWKPPLKIRSKRRFAVAANMLRRNIDFPIYRAPQVMLNQVSAGLPPIILAVMVSPASAGWYVLARTVVYLPVTIIGTSVEQSLYTQFARSGRDHTLRLLLKSTVSAKAGPFSQRSSMA